MSTPERPLTRRQLKELRMTGQLPVVVPGAPPVQQGQPADADEKPVAPEPTHDDADQRAKPTSAPQPPAPQPAAARPPVEPQDDPAADRAESDAGEDVPSAPADADAAASGQGRPLTRRQARILRTNSIAVPEPTTPAPSGQPPALPGQPSVVELPAGFADAVRTSGDQARDAGPAERPAPEPARSTGGPARPAAEAEPKDEGPKVGAAFGAAVFQQAEERQRLEREAAEREASRRRETKTVAPAPEQAAVADADEVFAEAFQRSLDAGGSTATGTSLILHDMPGTASLSAPITATGELLFTSSHVLPSGLSSRGAAAGTTDGKDVDATLLDGEIPMHSSPTPIAASAAVSTSKAPGDVIRPPAPEKNHGLMLTLGITAGVLGVALVGVIIYAISTGVFG
ncbi:hypothetical protein GCM10027064_21370 [Microbacterium petrolearium]|jgi:hypothetical protein